MRTTPEVHRAVASAAEAAGMSLNAWVETAIGKP
jgi:predicted HicB family RNase H-like nuclease